MEVIVGQRWHRLFRYKSDFDSSIVEVVEVLSNGNFRLKVLQVLESNSNAYYCFPKDSEWISETMPYGDQYSMWEILENQERPHG